MGPTENTENTGSHAQQQGQSRDEENRSLRARLCGELLRWVVIWTCISDLLGYKMTITVPFCSRKSVVYICRKYSNVLTDPGQIWQGEAARLGENGPGVGGTCPRHWPPEQAPVVTHWLLHPELMG